VNQETLEVFLYDSSITNTELHHIFNVYGGIKEVILVTNLSVTVT
jgi:hypothetical protein